MAKKADLLEEAKGLGLELTEKNTIAEIETAIAEAKADTEDDAKEVVKDTEVAEEATTDEEHFAKAGKRSEKNVKAAEAEAERQARKEAGDTTPQDGATANLEKGPAPKTRTLAERKGKNYRNVAKQIEAGKLYGLKEALELATKTATTKFDSTVEMHLRLGVDPKQADQNIRSTVVLPNGTGKDVKVAALVSDSDVEAAKAAGATYAGESEVKELLEKENLNFDILVATPQFMPKLGRFARLLGPRGLMPNPKAGTVSANPVEAVKQAKAGKVEYRVDKQGNIHMGIGKVSFGADKLLENANVLIASIKAARPSSLKGNYLLSANVTTTMGPGIKVNLSFQNWVQYNYKFPFARRGFQLILRVIYDKIEFDE